MDNRNVGKQFGPLRAMLFPNAARRRENDIRRAKEAGTPSTRPYRSAADSPSSGFQRQAGATRKSASNPYKDTYNPKPWRTPDSRDW